MEFPVIRQQESMFNTALPYGVATLAVGVLGAVTAVAAVAVIGKIIGIALGILGAYGFIGVVSCSLVSRNAQEFQQDVWKHMATSAGAGLSEIIVMVVKAVVLEAIFGSRRS